MVSCVFLSGRRDEAAVARAKKEEAVVRAKKEAVSGSLRSHCEGAQSRMRHKWSV